MSIGILVAALAATSPLAAASPPPLTLRRDVTLAGPDLRVSDLVAGSTRHGDLIVARVPEGVTRLSAGNAITLLRRRMPGAIIRTTSNEISIARPPALRRPGQDKCYELAGEVLADQPLASQDLAPVACRTARAMPAIRYDRLSGMALARRPLSVGTYVGRLALPRETMAKKGASLTLRSSAGPVTIEREVIAMQHARASGRLFVRDKDGHVFAAPLLLDGAR